MLGGNVRLPATLRIDDDSGGKNCGTEMAGVSRVRCKPAGVRVAARGVKRKSRTVLGKRPWRGRANGPSALRQRQHVHLARERITTRSSTEGLEASRGGNVEMVGKQPAARGGRCSVGWRMSGRIATCRIAPRGHCTRSYGIVSSSRPAIHAAGTIFFANRAVGWNEPTVGRMSFKFVWFPSVTGLNEAHSPVLLYLPSPSVRYS